MPWAIMLVPLWGSVTYFRTVRDKRDHTRRVGSAPDDEDMAEWLADIGTRYGDMQRFRLGFHIY